MATLRKGVDLGIRKLLPVALRNRVVTSLQVSRLSSDSPKQPWEPEEQVTHTGQTWTKDDYRLARFVGRPKQVNTQFAIDLINEAPPLAREDRVVSCDGGGGALGHPKVYINLDQPGNHSCGYCGLRFYLDHDKKH